MSQQGIGMTSQRTRERLIQRLMDQGISQFEVLEAIRSAHSTNLWGSWELRNSHQKPRQLKLCKEKINNLLLLWVYSRILLPRGAI